MGFSISRLTLYAILSNIEEDMRKIICTHLAPQVQSNSLFGEEILKKSRERLSKDIQVSAANISNEDLVEYIDYAEAFQIINAHRNLLPSSIAKHFQDVTKQLEKLVPVRNRVMHSRPLDPEDLSNTTDISRLLIRDKHTWSNLNEVLGRLQTEPTFVLNLHIPIYESSGNHNLPIPDFDETGFIGRKKQVDNLVKLCLGPYPVITIIGDGGIGKTATALKVAYEMLDKENCPFEAIVWTSSKTEQLTPFEIKRIEGAINDSLGMLQNVSDFFLGDKMQVSDPFSEVIEYLSNFKILLIIDNLETILDERIRSFLEHLPMGSKILLTSRIGLGAFERPVKLESMDQNDAVALLRATARIREVDMLINMPNDQLKAYCNRMKNSPGYIKWFVSAVRAGKRPEEVLAEPEMFLEFCMSNVYQYLSESPRKILELMLSVPGQHSQAELTFLAGDMDVINLQEAIQESLRSNMIVMSSQPIGNSFESKYSLTDMSREYLGKHHPASAEIHKQYSKRKQKLISTVEEFKASQRDNPYAYASINIRSRSEFVAAKYLKDAVEAGRSKRFSDADELLASAKRLSPGYFEVYRVEAQVRDFQENFPAAKTAYEAAIELEPNHAPLRAWYGGFLMRKFDDNENALKNFQEAEKIDPQSSEIQIEIARANLYLRNFQIAKEIIDKLLTRTDISEINRRKSYNLYFQFFHRKADYLLQQRNSVDALSCIKILKEEYNKCPQSIINIEIRKKVAKATVTAKRLVNSLQEPELIKAASLLHNWFLEEFSDLRDLSVIKHTPILKRRVDN
ncbi:MAG: AAA family ATPase [Nostoc sp. NMS7]|uniref:tetratricopeptide repeat protein n=1 Tax=Nostoc sp. NMS7 TaxID=2815391 RepID=UPI0025E5F995|nr:NB-ARC domain-containing protein [Nostoc sp. NMS7]MBN3945121.1 AAA family ATPase [Nostoc sp. NMS7]